LGVWGDGQGTIESEDACKILECGVSINEDRVVESPVAEQLKRISEQLKTARETAGIELAHVASQTFIPLRLLKAMDEGKFERLPEPVFVQGFIRRYGDAVGLDGKQMAKDFIVDPPSLKKPAEEFLSYHPDDDAPAPRGGRGAKKQKMQVPLPPAPTPAPAPVVEPVPVAPIVAAVEPVVTPVAEPVIAPTPIVAAVEPVVTPVVEPTPTPTVEPTTEIQTAIEPVAETNSVIEPSVKREPALIFDPASNVDREWSPSTGSSGQSGNGSSWLYWMGGLVALGLLAIGTVLVMQPKPNTAGNSSSSSVSTTVPSTPATPVPSATPKPTAPIVLTIKVVEESWIEVLSDGKSEIAEVMPKGTQKTWTAKESLSITSGNAKGVTYSYNQSPEKPMGTTADPETLLFPPLP
jgi:cytoskeleton protein RodZ